MTVLTGHAPAEKLPSEVAGAAWVASADPARMVIQAIACRCPELSSEILQAAEYCYRAGYIDGRMAGAEACTVTFVKSLQAVP